MAPSPAVALLLPRLVHHEGLRLTVYDDATGEPIRPGSVVVGHPTIGIGRCLDRKNGITPEEAQFLVENDVAKVVRILDRELLWLKDLDPLRRSVVYEMGFQLGIAGVLGFRRTLAAMEAGEWARAAAGMRASRWARQTPSRVSRLAAIIETGVDRAT